MNDKHNPSRKFSLTEILTAEYPLSIDCLNAIEKLVPPWERQAGDNISVKGKINDKWIFISTGLCRVYTTKKNKEDTIFFGGAGDIFTSFHSIFLQKKSVLGLQALSDCSGWSLSHYKYCLLQEKFPELLKFEINLLRGQLFALEHYYYSRALTDSSQRLEQFYEKRDALLEVFQPQTLIKSKPLRILAQYIGISPQMLSLLRNRQRGKR